MQEAVCQQALGRVLLYIHDSGLPLTPENCRKALHLVDAALEAGGRPEILAAAIDLVPRYFELPLIAFPVQRPPLNRGSIGYYPDD